MAAISRDKIKVNAPWKIQSLHALSIKKEFNNHAQMRINVLVNESEAARAGLKESVDDQVNVFIEDDEKKSWLFKGRLKNVKVCIQGGVYILTAECLSETSVLDRKKKSRSFQDTSLSYSDIAAKIMEDYPGKTFELTAEKVTIDGPLIQYEETDWQFIIRLASLQEDVIVPNVILNEKIFSFGYP
ncbi:MAG: phage late control D family protein, partial [Pelosinus sp.]|nr:phage late control D family protein [Pelosinus sp.]